MRDRLFFHNSPGFTRLEFVFLVFLGLMIAATLAHFVFDQSVQVEKLKALVHRDSVRMSLESKLLNPNVIRKSARALAKGETNLRACLLGEDNCDNKGRCCRARLKRPLLLLDLGDERKVIGGLDNDPSCLNENGEAISGTDCFATSRLNIDPICAQNAEACKIATAALITYQIDYLSPFFHDVSPLTVERTLSVLLEPGVESTGPQTSP